MNRIYTAANRRSRTCVALYYLIYAGTLALTTGCSISSSATNDWLQSGSLTISRPVPTADARASFNPTIWNQSKDFAPASAAPSLVISRQDKTLTAILPDSGPIVIKSEGAQHLPQGSFSVTIKEEKPLWYAPREYFTKRSLRVPEEGSRERFKRAALGNHTLFLNNQTPIHSGPVWLKEIGGIRLKNSEMEQLFSLVTIGTRVEVR